MDSLRLHNASSAIIHRIKDLLNSKSEAAEGGQEGREKPFQTLRAYLDWEYRQDGRVRKIADDFDDEMPATGPKARAFRQRLEELASGGRNLSAVLGEEVLRMKRSGRNSDPGFAALLWLIYKRCLHTRKKENEKTETLDPDYLGGVPKDLFPVCREGGSFNFNEPAQHFGRLALHSKDKQDRSSQETDKIQDLLKISFKQNAPAPNSDLGKAACQWMKRKEPDQFKDLRKKHSDSGDLHRAVFQRFVSSRLTWRQDAVAERLKAEIPLVLIWPEDGRNEELRFHSADNGNVGGFPNVFIISGKLHELVEAYLEKQDADPSDAGNPAIERLRTALKESLSFLRELRRRLKSLRNACSIKDAKLPRTAEAMIEFVVPLAFFANPVVLAAQYDPPEIPLSLSFNFSVNPREKESILTKAQLCDWAARCVVTMHNFLSESASLLNDCALEATSEAEGRQSGFLASAHDYSKDIGSVLLRLADFKGELDRSMGAIKSRAADLAALSAPASEIGRDILGELKAWSVPRFDWFSGVRFTNAHLETQTRGILLSEPAECVAMLERGTLRDIYEIVRVLVWHPIPLQKLKDKEAEFTQFAPEKLRLPSTWWTLFSFDLDPAPTSQSFHEDLGKRILSLILDERIEQPDFARRFPIPRINRETELDDPHSVLWPDCDPLQWRPLNGLLPLFVFSMRFAFQSAWAKTLIEEPKEAVPIDIAASRIADKSYQLTIRFPSPLNSDSTSHEDHPYHGEWEEQIDHYRKPAWKTSPWEASFGTQPVTLETKDQACIITLRATL